MFPIKTPAPFHMGHTTVAITHGAHRYGKDRVYVCPMANGINCVLFLIAPHRVSYILWIADVELFISEKVSSSLARGLVTTLTTLEGAKLLHLSQGTLVIIINTIQKWFPSLFWRSFLQIPEEETGTNLYSNRNIVARTSERYDPSWPEWGQLIQAFSLSVAGLLCTHVRVCTYLAHCANMCNFICFWPYSEYTHLNLL